MNGRRYRYGNEAEREPYHYTECGLSDVYLLCGYERVQTDEGPAVVIQNMDGLHRAIGDEIARNKKALDGADIRFLRKEMGLTQAELADLMGTTDQSVARWEKDENVAPGPAGLLLRLIYIAWRGGKIDPRKLAEQLREKDAPRKSRITLEAKRNRWHARAA